MCAACSKMARMREAIISLLPLYVWQRKEQFAPFCDIRLITHYSPLSLHPHPHSSVVLLLYNVRTHRKNSRFGMSRRQPWTMSSGTLIEKHGAPTSVPIKGDASVLFVVCSYFKDLYLPLCFLHYVSLLSVCYSSFLSIFIIFLFLDSSLSPLLSLSILYLVLLSLSPLC